MKGTRPQPSGTALRDSLFVEGRESLGRNITRSRRSNCRAMVWGGGGQTPPESEIVSWVHTCVDRRDEHKFRKENPTLPFPLGNVIQLCPI
jgi:hypothetical protein